MQCSIFQPSFEYVFNISSGYWTLLAVDVLGALNGSMTLDVIGTRPSAPLGFSYKCSRPLIFRNGPVLLELANIQVSTYFLSKNLLNLLFHTRKELKITAKQKRLSNGKFTRNHFFLQFTRHFFDQIFRCNLFSLHKMIS